MGSCNWCMGHFQLLRESLNSYLTSRGAYSFTQLQNLWKSFHRLLPTELQPDWWFRWEILWDCRGSFLHLFYGYSVCPLYCDFSRLEARRGKILLSFVAHRLYFSSYIPHCQLLCQTLFYYEHCFYGKTYDTIITRRFPLLLSYSS